MKTSGGMTYVTADEMKEIDATSIADYGLDVLSLMENAGRSTASIAWRMLGGDTKGGSIACLIGKGNNGGDGLVAARRLHNWGARVMVVLGAKREALEGVVAGQLEACERLGLKTEDFDAGLERFDLLVDALLGYNAKGDPREPLATIIRNANASGRPVLAVDVPSGLDPTEGTAGEPCIKADTTLTFGFPKVGFLNPASKMYVGKLFLADISLPRQFYQDRAMGGLFATDSIIQLW